MSTQLLFYHAGSGVAEFYTMDPEANLTVQKTYGTFYKDWADIVQIDSVFDAIELAPRGDLLLYGRDIGLVQFAGVYDGGRITDIRANKGFRKTWSHIITARFEHHSNLFFLDADNGQGEVYRYVPSRPADCDDSKANRGSGNISLVRSYIDLAKGWTHVVPGIFGGEFGGLLFYRKDGTAEVCRMDPHGNLSSLHTYQSFSKTWTQIVPLPFGFRTDLLFYDSAAGVGEVYHVDDQGNLALLHRLNNLAKTWTQIVPIETDVGFARPFLLFYDPAGIAETYHIDACGQLQFKTRSTSYRKNWTKILPVKVQMPPPVHRIRVHAVVAGSGPAAGGPSTTFTPHFSRDDIKPMVDVVNSYYRESGVQFEFDPATDIEEIESCLISQDQPLDAAGKPILVPPPGAAPLPGFDEERPLHEQGEARQEFGRRRRGRLVVLFRDDIPGCCFGPNYSSGSINLVIMARIRQPGGKLAHEIGHYLHLYHTFDSRLASVKDAQENVRKWVEDQDVAKIAIAAGKPIPDEIIGQGLTVFDGDLGCGVTDTRPDPSDSVFAAAQSDGLIANWNLDPLSITVTFSTGQKHQYVIDPDRWNIMSYFNNPGATRRLTPSQADVIRNALEKGNRQHLVRRP